MTNFEYYTSNIDILAKLISDSAYIYEGNWSKEFSDYFCLTCPSVHVTYTDLKNNDGTPKEDDFHECEFSDGVCPNGDDITWWLNRERIVG